MPGSVRADGVDLQDDARYLQDDGGYLQAVAPYLQDDRGELKDAEGPSPPDSDVVSTRDGAMRPAGVVVHAGPVCMYVDSHVA
jgi:hypothetical protein